MTVLLDGNVLIALLLADHVHHAAAEAWLQGSDADFATCPVTQGSLVRLVIRQGESAATATRIVSAVQAHPRHEFWPDDISYAAVPMAGVVGHRQVTDAYLAALARAHGGTLASFDQGLAALHADVVQLVPAGLPAGT
jgi:toxin-antitoxin system PIN domain toxin